MSLHCDIDHLQRLGGSIKPLNDKSTLLDFLGENSALVSTSQTEQELYRQTWRNFQHQDKDTLANFLARSTKPHSRAIKAALSSSMLIGVTKFAIQTCQRLAMSQITDLTWLSKTDVNVGMEVCEISVPGPP